MQQLNKYAKIVLLSTLEEPKTLFEISNIWFQNQGRLYQPIIKKEIEKAVKQKLLIKNKKLYHANIPKLIDLILQEVKKDPELIQEYKKELKKFYIQLGAYTRKVYFNFEIIQALTELKQTKASELNIKRLIELPFFLRLIRQKDKDTAIMWIQISELEDYVKLVDKLEIKYYYILKEICDYSK
jgi:hypothetical protein